MWFKTDFNSNNVQLTEQNTWRRVKKKFRNWHCFCLTTPLWNCSINPRCLSLEVKSKYSAIHLCCSFSEEFMFYMGGIVSKGPTVVSDSNESIHTSGLLLVLTECSSSSRRGKTRDGCARAHSFVRQRGIWHAHAHRKTLFTSYKSYMSCTLEGLLTFNRFQQMPSQTKDGFCKDWVLPIVAFYLLSKARKQ